VIRDRLSAAGERLNQGRRDASTPRMSAPGTLTVRFALENADFFSKLNEQIDDSKTS